MSAQSRALCVNIGATPSGRRAPREGPAAGRGGAGGGRRGGGGGQRKPPPAGGRGGGGGRRGHPFQLWIRARWSSPFPYAGITQFRFDGCVLRLAGPPRATPNGQR